MKPAYLLGFPHFFYANLDDPISDSDFDNWTLSIWRYDSEVSSSVGTLTKDIVDGTDFRFYATFTLSSSEISRGEHYFVIYNTVTESVKYISNCFKVIDEDDLEDWCLTEFRNSSSRDNYNYDVITNYNSIFLPFNLIESQPEVELTQYKERSTGLMRNQKAITAKIITIEAYYFDDEANDMMLALSGHDDIKLDGNQMEVKEAYQITTDRRNNVQKGTMQMYDQRYSAVNYNS